MMHDFDTDLLRRPTMAPRRTKTTFTVSEARVSLYRLIDEAAANHQPVVITGKRNSAVLISTEDWASMQETMYLLSVPGMRESIRAGLDEPIANCSNLNRALFD